MFTAMNAIGAGNAPPDDRNADIGWILIAAVLGFALLGLLGLVTFTAIALVLTWIVDLGWG